MAETLSSGYFEINKLNLDYGPIFSAFYYNDVEGLIIRVRGRTFKTINDLFRIKLKLAMV